MPGMLVPSRDSTNYLRAKFLDWQWNIWRKRYATSREKLKGPRPVHGAYIQQQKVAIKAEHDQQAVSKRRLSDFNDMVDTPDEPRERKRLFIDLTDEI
jgi:hypothetical protein